MALTDFINVVITSTGPAVTIPGFGVPLILAADTTNAFSNRVRSYNKPTDLIADGFVATGPTYLAAQALCAQTPRPPTFKVGRLANIPAMAFTMVPVVTDNTLYSFALNGQAVTFTSGSSTTATLICNGLRTAIAALSPAITGLTTGGTATLTLTMTAGLFLNVNVTALQTTLLKTTQTTTDPGLAADLAAVFTEDSNWYCLLNCFNSAVQVTAIATFAEANKKLFCAQVGDSDCVNTVLSGATDIMAAQKTAAHYYTNLWYSGATGDFLDASIAGVKLTSTPGSEIWGLTTISGPAAQSYTATQRTNALAKNGNLYEANVAGLNITDPGKATSGEWIDVVRFKDWQTADMAAAVFALLHNAAQTNSKIPYTDDGIQAVKGVMLASLKRGVAAGGLASNPAPTVTAPLRSAVSSVDVGNRALTTMVGQAYLAGAIQAVGPISITLTY